MGKREMKPDRDIDHLHPIMRPLVRTLLATLYPHTWKGEDGRSYGWAMFEGYRSPEAQHMLFTETKSTHVDAWGSAHQFGLAVDIVPCTLDPQGARTLQDWSWARTHPWAKMHVDAAHCGLITPLAWDMPHVEHPIWLSIPHRHV